MSRRTVVTATCALLLGGALTGPALAQSAAQPSRSVFCLELNDSPNSSNPQGFCVWAPLPR